MASSRTVVVLALLLHAACLSSPHRLVAGYSSPLSEAASTRREMAKAPVNCPDGVVCPMGAYCRLDRNDFPFCTCPFGHALNNGYCNRYYRWRTVGTSVVLYNAPSFANSPATLPPAVLRDPPPNSSACTLVPKGFSGTVGSLRILWNVDDGIRDQPVCGKVLFWDKSNCSGSASVYVIPGKWTTAKFNKLDYATTSVKKTAGVDAKARSFSCLMAVKPNVTNLCDIASCPPDSTCTLLKNSSLAQCTCGFGLAMDPDGACVDACSIKDCGTGGSCVILSNDNAYCNCKQGYELEGVLGTCIGEGQCKDCLQGTFGPNSLPYPYCAPGFNMNSGVCLP
ncbi:unnamed protein product, partial [Closterium sp. Naga37s-1]